MKIQQPMTEKIYLREAGRNDDETIAKLSIKAWQDSYSNILPITSLTNLQWQVRANGREVYFQQDLKRKSLVIEINNSIVAFADFGPARLQANTEIDSTYSEIYAIYVLNSFKRKGLGTMLYNTIEKIFIDNGYKKLIIWTLTKNAGAIRFYKAMGLITQPWHKQFSFDNGTYDESAFTKIFRINI